MQRPCSQRLCECPGVDAPITNISAEALDPLLFWGQIWNPYNPWRPPRLGNGVDVKVDCDVFNEIFSVYDPVVYASTQLMVNLQALAASLGCPWPPSGEETFTNDAQTASVYCPDGTMFSYTVDAGTMTSPPMDAEFGAAWVLWANAWAEAYAYQQASALLSCFEEDETPDDLPPDGGGPGDDPPIPPTPPAGGGGMLPDVLWTCLGEGVYRVYTMSGSASSSYTISLVDGSLPPGTALVPIDGRRISLTGVPTTAGGYAFKLRAVSTTSPTVAGEVWIAVYIFGLTTSTLPDGDIGVAYSHALTSSGGTAPYTYALADGSDPLPDGLLLDGDGSVTGTAGTIYGTPTVSDDFNFTLTVTDANEGECDQDVSLSVVGVLNSYVICRWTQEVLPVLTEVVPGAGCVASVAPAWNGVFDQHDIHIDTAIPAQSGGEMIYFNNQSITIAPNTREVSPTSLPTYPAGDWNDWSQYHFSCIWWRPDTARWNMMLCCAATSASAGYFWFGYNNSHHDPTNAAGNYTSLGPFAPFDITVQNLNNCCCQENVATPPPAYVAQAYYHVLPTPTFGSGPYTFSIPAYPAADSLPEGLTLDGTTGVISGVPTTLGTRIATLTSTDSLGAESCCNVTFEVIALDWLSSIVWVPNHIDGDLTWNLGSMFGNVSAHYISQNNILWEAFAIGNNTTGLTHTVRVTLYLVGAVPQPVGWWFDSNLDPPWESHLLMATIPGAPTISYDYTVDPGIFNIKIGLGDNFVGYDFEAYFTMEIL